MTPNIKCSGDSVLKQYEGSLNIISALTVVVLSKENFICWENTEGASLRGEEKKQMLPKSYLGNQMEIKMCQRTYWTLRTVHSEERRETWFSQSSNRLVMISLHCKLCLGTEDWYKMYWLDPSVFLQVLWPLLGKIAILQKILHLFFSHNMFRRIASCSRGGFECGLDLYQTIGDVKKIVS